MKLADIPAFNKNLSGLRFWYLDGGRMAPGYITKTLLLCTEILLYHDYMKRKFKNSLF